ncbi:MAG: hypothetical protein ACI9WU_001880 [Myxococcota bacterium]|jgi:hypothetical protein
MNARERNLVLALGGVVLLLAVGAGVVWVRGTLAAKQDKISKNRKQWTEIQRRAGPWLAKQAQEAAILERVKSNPDALSPDNPVAEIAVKTPVHYRTGSDGQDEEAPLNKILQVTGDLLQRPLLQKKKKQAGPQIFRVEKQFQMRRGFARTDDIWDFLGSVEAFDSLVFVTKLHIVRWSRDADFVQIKNLTASTLRYEDQ